MKTIQQPTVNWSCPLIIDWKQLFRREYNDFIQRFIDKIVIGRYIVDITLKTGLDIYPKIDTTYNVKQQETYKMKKTVLAVFF